MWRNLSEYEKEQIKTFYKNKHKAVAWFFYIWATMGGCLIVFGSIAMVVMARNGSMPMTDLFCLPLLWVFGGLGFVFFPLWVLNMVSGRELKAIKKNTAKVCNVKVIDKRKSVVMNNNHKRHTYLLKVIVPRYLEVNNTNPENCVILEVECNEYTYDNIYADMEVCVFAHKVCDFNNTINSTYVANMYHAFLI